MNKFILLGLLFLSVAIHCHAGHDHQHHHVEGDHHHDDEVTKIGKYEYQSHVLLLNDETIQDALDEFPLILVKFFAPWCGHCKTLAPAYKELAIQLAHSDSNEYVIASVDCTINKEACNKHSIRGYPTLKYFIDGEAHQFSGSRSKENILAFLQNKKIEVRAAKGTQEL